MSTHDTKLLQAGATVALQTIAFGHLMAGEKLRKLIEHGARDAAVAEAGNDLLLVLLLRNVAAVHTAIRRGRDVGDALLEVAGSPDGQRLMDMALTEYLAKGGNHAPR